MSQDFRQRYEQLRAGDPTKPVNTPETLECASYYETLGHGRSLCLVWPDGRRMFLNYAYLVSGEFTIEGETNIITLHFSLHTVTVKGYVLEALFTALLDHLPRILSETDPRYTNTDGQDSTIIELLVISSKS